MFQLTSKFIRWYFRRWQKTARGKWHIVSHGYPLKDGFVPACRLRAVWESTATKKHTPPKGETVCKICAKLQNKLY